LHIARSKTGCLNLALNSFNSQWNGDEGNKLINQKRERERERERENLLLPPLVRSRELNKKNSVLTNDNEKEKKNREKEHII
jgi:hypothetical protein